MYEGFKRLNWILASQFGFDVRRTLLSLRGIPRFLRDWRSFNAVYAGKIELQPCLYDWHEQGGSANNEYFLQDLYVARKIFRANPNLHVDVGSRVDGFVAHVASFREIVVFDIRPIEAKIPGITFLQTDLMDPGAPTELCDSLSCLHALEHFGLGRYGDPLDVDGSGKGFVHLAKLLKPAGQFYLSVPIGLERVAFNANRVFDPYSILEMGKKNALEMKAFAFIDETRKIRESLDPPTDMARLARGRYSLGIFEFVKSR